MVIGQGCWQGPTRRESGSQHMCLVRPVRIHRQGCCMWCCERVVGCRVPRVYCESWYLLPPVRSVLDVLRIWRWRVSADGRSSEKLERLTARRTVAQDLVASKQRSAWVLFKPLVFVYSAPGHTRQIASRLTNGRLARRRYGGRTKLRVLFQGGTVQLCRCMWPFSD